MQLPFLQLLTSWLTTQPELKSLVDTDTIGVAGHSRGAKLAALHFASGKLMKAIRKLPPKDPLICLAPYLPISIKLAKPG